MASEHGAVFDARVIAYPYLAAHNDVIFYGDAATQTGLGGDNYVLAYLTVVSDVDEVVDLCALAYAGFIQRASIDG